MALREEPEREKRETEREIAHTHNKYKARTHAKQSHTHTQKARGQCTDDPGRIAEIRCGCRVFQNFCGERLLLALREEPSHLGVGGVGGVAPGAIGPRVGWGGE